MDKKYQQTDVILITGWLGSGKTTLLNRLLKAEDIQSLEPALVVNEFGEVGVDGQLVSGCGRPVYEINKGSLFCICTKVDFVKAMLAIRDDMPKRPGVVIIEATGVAEAVDLESLLDERILGGAFVVRAVICVIDAAGFVPTAAFSRGAASQARAADLLVVNKTDLVSEAELAQLQKLLTDMNPDAAIVSTSECEIDSFVPNVPNVSSVPNVPNVLKSLTHKRRSGYISAGPPKDIVSVSVRDSRPVDRRRWEELIDQLGDKLLRLKGNVNFSMATTTPATPATPATNASPVTSAAAASSAQSETQCRMVEISISTQKETEPLAGISSKDQQTAFVAIARDIEKDQLKAKLEKIFQ